MYHIAGPARKTPVGIFQRCSLCGYLLACNRNVDTIKGDIFYAWEEDDIIKVERGNPRVTCVVSGFTTKELCVGMSCISSVKELLKMKADLLDNLKEETERIHSNFENALAELQAIQCTHHHASGKDATVSCNYSDRVCSICGKTLKEGL